MRNVTFSIEGMHCDGCANTIQSLLERQAGVEAAQVSFAEGVARVLFDPDAVSENALVASIEEAGFQIPGARSC